MTETGAVHEPAPEEHLLRDTAKAVWWMVLIRAVLMVIFGVVTLSSPGIALFALVFVFGFYAILDGLTAIVAGVRSRATEKQWGWMVAQGVISVLAGLVALVWPGGTAVTLLYVIAFWAIVLGVATIAEAIRTRRTHDRWYWTLAGGVLDIIFGIVLLVQPLSGIIALLFVVGIFAIVAGIVMAVLAFRIRKLATA
ncbi:HdeD family acid-resistance protein [Pseudonocardia ailaonensis]|uniref:HdeD family acid-resistance protein n=1 Tax=Pseudonocardia ailaonensis TaxID=367279 RepID=A0ABN2N1N4_9PSEU